MPSAQQQRDRGGEADEGGERDDVGYFRRRGEVDPSHERLLDEAAAKLDVFCA